MRQEIDLKVLINSSHDEQGRNLLSTPPPYGRELLTKITELQSPNNRSWLLP